MCNYNLFRHTDHAELLCAVPEARPVPPFIKAPPWRFVGCVRDCANGSPGFNHRVAEESVHFNGFYLFQPLNASDLELWAVSDDTRQCGVDLPACGSARQPKPPAQRMHTG